MSAERPLALVSGAGPGLGTAVARRFLEEGYRVVGLARSRPPDLPTGLEQCDIDLSDASAVGAALDGILARHGAPAVIVHNPAALVIKPFLETAPEEFEACWRAMTHSAVLVLRRAIPAMLANGGGSVIVSGATASLRGGARFAAFAAAKFALRGLSQSLAREFQGQGIHVAHVILDGILDTARSRDLHGGDASRMMKPDEVAEIYLRLVEQPTSVWSHEIDLRPMSEGF